MTRRTTPAIKTKAIHPAPMPIVRGLRKLAVDEDVSAEIGAAVAVDVAVAEAVEFTRLAEAPGSCAQHGSVLEAQNAVAEAALLNPQLFSFS
jgi:hypothetical protein